MVVFSCDGCGEVLKKQQVDAHAGRCRSCASVSCADCAVHFFGDDYRTHTTCMTEAERYEKSVYRPNASSTKNNNGNQKKRNPQEEWMDLIARAAAADVPLSSSSSSSERPQQRQLLQTLATLGNVPRKEKQFRNFAMNSLNLRGTHCNSKSSMALLDQVWAYLNTMRNAENDARKKQEAKEKEVDDERKRKEMDVEEREIRDKAVVVNIDDDDSNSDGAESVEKVMTIPPSKVVRKAVRKILKKEEKKCIKIKLLRSKLRDALGLDKSLQKELKKMLQKELKAQDTKIKVDGKMVQLL